MQCCMDGNDVLRIPAVSAGLLHVLYLFELSPRFSHFIKHYFCIINLHAQYVMINGEIEAVMLLVQQHHILSRSYLS